MTALSQVLKQSVQPPADALRAICELIERRIVVLRLKR
jgi:hypothetical protein